MSTQYSVAVPRVVSTLLYSEYWDEYSTQYSQSTQLCACFGGTFELSSPQAKKKGIFQPAAGEKKRVPPLFFAIFLLKNTPLYKNTTPLFRPQI